MAAAAQVAYVLEVVDIEEDGDAEEQPLQLSLDGRVGVLTRGPLREP